MREADIPNLTIAIGSWMLCPIGTNRSRLLLDQLALDPDIDVRGYEMQQEGG